jgi:hypothetical protein
MLDWSPTVALLYSIAIVSIGYVGCCRPVFAIVGIKRQSAVCDLLGREVADIAKAVKTDTPVCFNVNPAQRKPL